MCEEAEDKEIEAQMRSDEEAMVKSKIVAISTLFMFLTFFIFTIFFL